MGFQDDFKAALAQKRPQQVQQEDLNQGIDNIKRLANGQGTIDGVDGAPADPHHAYRDQTVYAGPAVQSPQEQMATQMAAQNQAQAAHDPVVAAKMAAMQAAVAKYHANAAAPQVDALQAIEDEKKKNQVGQSYPATE